MRSKQNSDEYISGIKDMFEPEEVLAVSVIRNAVIEGLEIEEREKNYNRSNIFL